MEMVFEIKQDGIVEGLYNDFLSTIPGEKEIKRFSNVEYNLESGGWIVSIEEGKYKGCFLPKVFIKRQEAIKAEIKLFNETYFQ